MLSRNGDLEDEVPLAQALAGGIIEADELEDPKTERRLKKALSGLVRTYAVQDVSYKASRRAYVASFDAAPGRHASEGQRTTDALIEALRDRLGSGVSLAKKRVKLFFRMQSEPPRVAAP